MRVRLSLWAAASVTKQVCVPIVMVKEHVSVQPAARQGSVLLAGVMDSALAATVQALTVILNIMNRLRELFNLFVIRVMEAV